MRKIVYLLLLFIFCFSIPVFADEEGEKEVTQQTEQETKGSVPSPVSINRKNIDGTEYLIKTYEVAATFNSDLLVEDGFEQDGFLFAHFNTEKNPIELKDSKEAKESVTIETKSNSMEGILKRLPSTMDYSKEGYIGKLALDTGSITTDVNGYTTNTSTVSTVKDYPGLMYADPSYVPQTATKDGYTLPLTDVQWVVMGTGLAGDTLVPTEYKATATYSKAVTSKVAAGYVTSANYHGTVTKTQTNAIQYLLTYVGTPVYKPITEASQPVVSEKEFSFPWRILLTFLLIATVIGGGIFLFFFLKTRNGIQIYNLIDKEYIYIGKQVIDLKKPVLDLNEFKDIIQSNSFAFVLNIAVTNKLFGRNLSVTLDDLTVKHNVKGYNEKYRFNLELGGILDVQ